jgi:hypothetical protein
VDLCGFEYGQLVERGAAERLVASHVGLSSMELVTQTVLLVAFNDLKPLNIVQLRRWLSPMS